MRPANEALIVIDVQNDFCPGGALAVAGGDEIIRRINALMDDFADRRPDAGLAPGRTTRLSPPTIPAPRRSA